jgi:hypothetical protein
MGIDIDDPSLWGNNTEGRPPPVTNGDLAGGYGGGLSREGLPVVAGEQAPAKSRASGLGEISEGLGLSSSYRPGGYNINKNSGYVGGSYGNSQGDLANYDAAAQAARNYQAAYQQNYNAALAQGQGARGYQDAAAQSYLGTLNGTQPSLAQLQLQQGMRAGMAQQASMAAGARGGGANLAAAQLAGASNAGQIAAGTNQQAAMLRAQEYANAQAGLAGVGGQMRGQDYQAGGLAQQGQNMYLTAEQAQEAMRQKQRLGELAAQAGLEAKQGDLTTEQQNGFARAEGISGGSGGSAAGGILGGLGAMFSFL